MISVFDYGAGNLQSVQNTLGAIGAQYELIRDAKAIEQSHKLILPGVGHFGQMMRALDTLGVRDAIVNRIRVGIPFLGICLGLQALFESSEEAPEVRGLGIYPGWFDAFRATCVFRTWAGINYSQSVKAGCCRALAKAVCLFCE